MIHLQGPDLNELLDNNPDMMESLAVTESPYPNPEASINETVKLLDADTQTLLAELTAGEPVTSSQIQAILHRLNLISDRVKTQFSSEESTVKLINVITALNLFINGEIQIYAYRTQNQSLFEMSFAASAIIFIGIAIKLLKMSLRKGRQQDDGPKMERSLTLLHQLLSKMIKRD